MTDSSRAVQARRAYDEIREKFGIYISTWKTREVDQLDAFIDKEVINYMSIVKAYTCGSQHSLFGVKNFILDIPRTDFFNLRICNFTARVQGHQASQFAYVVATAGNFNEDGTAKTFEFTAMLANQWEEKDGRWMLTLIRMDVCGLGGELEDFTEAWYFDEPVAKWYQGVHHPCIFGELDSPWYQIPDSEVPLSDEEQIMDTYAKYAFSVDMLDFDGVNQTFSEDILFLTPPWGCLNKRARMDATKFHRKKDRYWVHPAVPECIDIQGDLAHVKLFRMSGHRQRTHAYVYMRDNADLEHACARFDMWFRKEEGEWKIYRWNGYLGIIELGRYGTDPYGEEREDV